MRYLVLITLCLLAGLPLLSGQDKNVADLIAARKWLDENEILARLDKNGGVRLAPGDWDKLRRAGFSTSFITRLQQLLAERSKATTDKAKSNVAQLEKSETGRQPDKRPASQAKPATSTPVAKLYKIKITIRPEGAGQVVITPAPDAQGRGKADQQVSLMPRANHPYLFDHWQGDLRGYQPLRMKLVRDLHLIAVFQRPARFKQPPKIKNPVEFRETRRAGYLYKGEVVGVVEGRGASTDWGIAGEVEYKYIYHLNYTSDVLSNNGYRIRELRTFDTVQETMLISKYRFHLDLRNDFAMVKKVIIGLGEMLELLGSLGECSSNPNIKIPAKVLKFTGKLARHSAVLADWAVGTAEKITIDHQQVDAVLKQLEGMPGAGKWVARWRERLANPNLGRVLGYAPNLKLLEGKKFELEYEDGIGLVKVDVADDNQLINTRERELLERAFYLSDYYIFRDSDHPRRPLQIGDRWKVDARTVAGVLDPRLRHQATGRVEFLRANNRVYANKQLAVFKLEQGKVRMVPPRGPQKIEGEIAFTDGEIGYDLELNYVARSFLCGVAKYREVSTDHMFFGARLSTQPRVTIRYECSASRK